MSRSVIYFILLLVLAAAQTVFTAVFIHIFADNIQRRTMKTFFEWAMPVAVGLAFVASAATFGMMAYEAWP